MNEFKDAIKKLLNKDVTLFLNKYKIPLVSILVVSLLACIGFIVTYAFYQAVDVTPIIGGSTGKIADLEVRIMAEERDTNGNGLGSYALYPYIPKAGFLYNSSKSYCTNNSTINYNAEAHNAKISASGHDVCYLYFDSIASPDLTLYVYAENIDNNGEGTGEYTKLETTALPSTGYELNTSKSKCDNGSTISYNNTENMFTIEATQKDTCEAYMDALDVDIALKLYIQSKSGSSTYYETKKIPTNAYYTINNEKSSCTGTSTISLSNQKVVIAATSKTHCVAYLDISTGPILESMNTTVDGTDVTITLTPSNLGTTARTYYFSKDGGATYVSSSSNSYTFTGLNPLTSFTFYGYYVDSNGNSSATLETSAKTEEDLYVYNGVFDYQTNARTKVIEKSGYYYLQVWGAQGATSDSKTGGLGGYSYGKVYLNEGDTLYIHTGGQGGAGFAGVNGGGGAGTSGGGGGGATDIRINNDSLYARVIVAGGGGGYGQDTCATAAGGYGGGASGGGNVILENSCGTQAGGGSQTAGGAGGIYSSTSGDIGTFGAGATAIDSNYDGGGGGGGWYGGGAGASAGWSNSGGGGSGWIYTESTYNAWSAANSSIASNWLLNSNYYLQNASTTAGDTAFESTSGGTETGHAGNGYAKVTYIGSSL